MVQVRNVRLRIYSTSMRCSMANSSLPAFPASSYVYRYFPQATIYTSIRGSINLHSKLSSPWTLYKDYLLILHSEAVSNLDQHSSHHSSINPQTFQYQSTSDTTNQKSLNTTKMSPPSQQPHHIYIPNLQGLQILQITPYTDTEDDQEEEQEETSYTSNNTTPTNTPLSSAPSSPRTSVSYSFNIPDDAF